MNEEDIFFIERESNQDEFYPYSLLYSAILKQAFLDLINKSKRTEDKIAKLDSIKFFFDKGYNNHFEFILYFSQYKTNKSTIRKNILKYIKTFDRSLYDLIIEKSRL